MHTANGATMMTPRGAVAGLNLRPGAPPPSSSPRAATTLSAHCCLPRGGYSTLGGVDGHRGHPAMQLALPVLVKCGQPPRPMAVRRVPRPELSMRSARLRSAR